jgi:hypothetical protein
MASPTLTLWLKEADRERFREVCRTKEVSDAGLVKYLDNILTAQLRKPGVLSRISQRFVLGKRGLWLPEEKPFVYIKNHPLYGEGLFLSTYSLTDVECHLKSKPINITAGVHREEIMGMEQEDFVERVFRTYESGIIATKGEEDKHLLLYSVNPQA